MDRMHYYHQMPAELVRIRDGMQATVVFQSHKSMEMLYNMTGFHPDGSDDIIRCYRHEPVGHICYHWLSLDEIATGCYLDQFMLEDLVTRPEELEHLHLLKTWMTIYLCEDRIFSETKRPIRQ